MALAAASSVENNFRNGLITEATGLNFPENACTETYNCTFNLDGSVQRRLGLDFEAGFDTKNIDRDNNVVTSYVWRNVAGNGDVTILVLQVGATLHFFLNTGSVLSTGNLADTVDLTSFSPAGAPTPEVKECQFCDGNGLLFVTHPYLDTFYVEFDQTTEDITTTQVDILIRDFEGDSSDTNGISNRPTASLSGLAVNHKYNLYNQGWTTTNLTAWDSAQTTMPSNADRMYLFKDSNDAFSASNTTIANVDTTGTGNTQAPKGHFILNVYDQDRDSASGLSGVMSSDTGYQRSSTCAFFAGRVFYSGINYVGFNSKIYFTQVIENKSQYGLCYQVNDPTSESYFDLLPTDGGVISIAEAGTIYKLFPIIGGLVVFAGNGVWLITGSTGLGFTANDYTVQKISSVNILSAASFVDVAGFPMWWNTEGIYTLVPGQQGAEIKSLTNTRIDTFYAGIPITSKFTAKGYYSPIDQVVQWVYRSTDSATPTEAYEYDRILNFDTSTGAFYPWAINAGHDVKINGIIVLDTSQGTVEVVDIVDDNGDTVVNDDGDAVIAFQTGGTTDTPPSFKYIVSYSDGAGSYEFTFAEAYNPEYIDWFSYDTTGEDFTSYFITGYKIRGEGIKKFQTNWVEIFSRMTVFSDIAYHFQALWDYALTGSGTGRWSSSQLVTNNENLYSTTTRRLKVRGHGIAVQFKVTSYAGKPFDLIGWVNFETGNTLP